MHKLFDLNRTVTWKAWQYGVFKLSVLSFGIIFGAYFADFFRNYYGLLGLIAVITTIPLIKWWLQD